MTTSESGDILDLVYLYSFFLEERVLTGFEEFLCILAADFPRTVRRLHGGCEPHRSRDVLVPLLPAVTVQLPSVCARLYDRHPARYPVTACQWRLARRRKRRRNPSQNCCNQYPVQPGE